MDLIIIVGKRERFIYLMCLQTQRKNNMQLMMKLHDSRFVKWLNQMIYVCKFLCVTTEKKSYINSFELKLHETGTSLSCYLIYLHIIMCVK